MTDLVNHPPHYTSNPFGLETIEITRHYNFDIGNALKYILRAGRKGLGDWAGKELMPVDEAQAKITDLRKAVWYLLDEIESTRAQFAGVDLDDPYGTNQPDQDEDENDDMVERAARTAWEWLILAGFDVEPWDKAGEADREATLAQMRAALTAALGGGERKPTRDEANGMVDGEVEAIASFLRDNPGLAGLAFSEAIVELPDVTEGHARVLREGSRIPRHLAEES